MANMIPIRMVQGVTTHCEGLRFTAVKVTTAGDSIEFHVSRNDAANIKETLINLMNQGPTPALAAMPAPASQPPSSQAAEATASPATSVAEELKKLAELRDSGVLTGEEFGAQKAKLLAG